MDAIVQPPIEAIREHQRVHAVRLAKPGEDHIAHIRQAVRPCILQVNQVAARRDKDAATPARNCRSPRQVVGVNRARVELALALRVFQQPDAAGMRVCPAPTGSIRPFEDKQPALLIKRHRDRGANQRIGRGQLEAKARLDAEVSRRIRGCRNLHARPRI